MAYSTALKLTKRKLTILGALAATALSVAIWRSIPKFSVGDCIYSVVGESTWQVTGFHEGKYWLRMVKPDGTFFRDPRPHSKRMTEDGNFKTICPRP